MAVGLLLVEATQRILSGCLGVSERLDLAGDLLAVDGRLCGGAGGVEISTRPSSMVGESQPVSQMRVR